MKRKKLNFNKMISVFVACMMIASIFAMYSTSAQAAEIIIPDPIRPTTTVVVASNDSPQNYLAGGAEEADYICTNGVLSSTLKNSILAGNKIFRFAPGSYLIEGITLALGNTTVLEGIAPITQPLNFKEVMYPDSTKMAVFETRTQKLSTEEASSIKGSIETKNAGTNITISNIALSGHTILKLNNAKNSKVNNVLVHNYRGTYPNGEWCNMGYGGATASLWIFGVSENITLENCQVQFSSHHGFAFHSGVLANLAKNVIIKKVRALYCGNGMLRGQTADEINRAKIMVPERDGYGYYDWSTGFDVCETLSVENVRFEDCYALSGWKAGFYMEPKQPPTNVVGLSLIRCRSDDGGQRNWFIRTRDGKRYTYCQVSEGANFFMQGGYFEDCISVNAEKCGWYLNPDRIGANGNPNDALKQGKIQMRNCGDYGSPMSLATVMFDSCELYADGFWSLNAGNIALSLFGGNPADDWPGNDFHFTNTTIMAKDGQTVNPIRIGYMNHIGMLESLDTYLQSLNATGGKYDILRSHITDSSINATLYNLGSSVQPVNIVQDATFNGYGASDSNNISNGISISRMNASKVNIANYVNDNWGKPLYRVIYNSNGGTAVVLKNVVAENTITAPTPPKRTAYTFLGWYTAKTGGTKVTFPYKVSGPVTLYAHWKVAKPNAPTKVTAKRIAKRTIRIKWAAATKVAGYSIYRAVKATGTYKRIANTKYLTYTNKKLIASKYYYYKVRAYRMSGKTKVYGNMSKRIRARA